MDIGIWPKCQYPSLPQKQEHVTPTMDTKAGTAPIHGHKTDH